jgi:hypothetical protein
MINDRVQHLRSNNNDTVQLASANQHPSNVILNTNYSAIINTATWFLPHEHRQSQVMNQPATARAHTLDATQFTLNPFKFRR